MPTGITAEPRKKVVLDTAAFIKQARLDKLGDDFFTTPDVISEIRDSRARLYLETIPVKIVQREPTSDAVAAGTQTPLEFVYFCFLHSVDVGADGGRL